MDTCTPVHLQYIYFRYARRVVANMEWRCTALCSDALHGFQIEAVARNGVTMAQCSRKCTRRTILHRRYRLRIRVGILRAGERVSI